MVALIESARRPLNLRAYALYWANAGSQQFNRRTFEEKLEMQTEIKSRQCREVVLLKMKSNCQKKRNELVAPLGYEPIENFYISGKFNVD